MVAVVRSLGRNLGANLMGRAVATLAQLVAIPFLLRLLGADGFGLLGISLTLQAIAAVPEIAFSLSTNREVAQARAQGAAGHGDVLQVHVAAASWCTLAWALVLGLLAPAIGGLWIGGTSLGRDEVVVALALMAVTSGLQIVTGSGFGALLAADRHVTANALLALWAGLRTVGAVLVLQAFGGGIVVYFGWLVLVSAAYAGLSLAAASRATGWQPAWPRLDFGVLRLRLGFVGGMVGMGILGIVIGQMDRIVLMHGSTLADFGYYALAANIAGALAYIAGPVVQASFPALAGLLSRNEDAEVARLFRLLTQLLTALTIPPALIFSIYARELLWLWTGDAAAASAASHVLPLLLVGAALNALFYLPYHLQLATGRTRPILVFLAGALAPVALGMSLLVWLWGPVGAAFGWLLLNAAMTLLLAPLLLRPMIPGGAGGWWAWGVLPPLLGTLPPVLAAWLLLPADASVPVLLAVLAAAMLGGMLGGFLAASELRYRLWRALAAP